jgi:hypothetical protein
VRLDRATLKVVQGVVFDAHLLTHVGAQSLLARVVFVVAFEVERVDAVAKVVTATVLGQVWYEIIDVATASLECPTRGQVKVSDDFVDPDPARDVAALFGLLLQVLRVVLLSALLDPVGVAKAPTTIHICLPDLFAGVTALLLGGLSTVARATVARNNGVIPGNVALEVRRVGIGDDSAVLLKTGFDDVVGKISLQVSRNVHDVEAENYKPERSTTISQIHR